MRVITTPKFRRQDFRKMERIKNNPGWRKPKGRHSKVSRKKKGFPSMPEKGYRTPKTIRGLHPCWLKIVEVSNPAQLSNVDPKTEAVRVRSVGLKKKVEIIKKAAELKIKLLNTKDIKEYLSNVEKQMKERKERRKSFFAQKDAQKKKREKKKEEKKAKEEAAPADKAEEMKKMEHDMQKSSQVQKLSKKGEQ